jgi:hypothetical protein
VLITNHDRTVTILRRTAYVVDAIAVTASVTVSRQPVRAGCLRVTLASGTSSTGTVTITGTVGGVAGVQEALTFTGNGSLTTTKQFSAVSAISTSGLADEPTPPTFSMQCIGPDGQPQATSYTLASNWPASRTTAKQSWPSPTQGSSPEAPYVYLIQYTELFEPRRGDILRDDSTGEDWLVQGVNTSRGPIWRGFWRLDTTQYQA